MFSVIVYHSLLLQYYNSMLIGSLYALQYSMSYYIVPLLRRRFVATCLECSDVCPCVFVCSVVLPLSQCMRTYGREGERDICTCTLCYMSGGFQNTVRNYLFAQSRGYALAKRTWVPELPGCYLDEDTEATISWAPRMSALLHEIRDGKRRRFPLQ